MENSRKIKKVHICNTCKGNGYVKIKNNIEPEPQVHQCWDCESQGEFYEYVTKDNNLVDDGISNELH